MSTPIDLEKYLEAEERNRVNNRRNQRINRGDTGDVNRSPGRYTHMKHLPRKVQLAILAARKREQRAEKKAAAEAAMEKAKMNQSNQNTFTLGTPAGKSPASFVSNAENVASLGNQFPNQSPNQSTPKVTTTPSTRSCSGRKRKARSRVAEVAALMKETDDPNAVLLLAQICEQDFSQSAQKKARRERMRANAQAAYEKEQTLSRVAYEKEQTLSRVAHEKEQTMVGLNLGLHHDMVQEAKSRQEYSEEVFAKMSDLPNGIDMIRKLTYSTAKMHQEDEEDDNSVGSTNVFSDTEAPTPGVPVAASRPSDIQDGDLFSGNPKPSPSGISTKQNTKRQSTNVPVASQVVSSSGVPPNNRTPLRGRVRARDTSRRRRDRSPSSEAPIRSYDFYCVEE